MRRLRARLAPGRVGAERVRGVRAGKFANGTRHNRRENCRQLARAARVPRAPRLDMCEADYYYDGGSASRVPDGDAPRTRRSGVRGSWTRASVVVDTPAIYRCKRNDGCVGGEGSGDALCADNHHGPLCHLCDEGYYMEHVLRTCLECKSRPTCSSRWPSA